MTPAGWRKLAVAVGERSAWGGEWPTPEARMVLQAVLLRFAREEQPPAQDAFARELGLSERRLRVAIEELTRHGLMAFDGNRGRAPGRYSAWEDRIRAWTKHELELEAPAPEAPEATVCGDESDTTTAVCGAENAPTTGLCGDGSSTTTLARARVLAAAAEDVAATDVVRAEAEEAAVRAAVAALRAGGVRCPLTVQRKVRAWIRKGLQPDDFELVADEAGAHGGQWAYCERIVERLWDEATGGRVAHIEDYRAFRPWAGGGAS